MEPGTRSLARAIARPYLHQVDQLLGGEIDPGAFAWKFEQAWLAQPGEVPPSAYGPLNELFVVAAAWDPDGAAAGDADATGPAELLAAATTCRAELLAALS